MTTLRTGFLALSLFTLVACGGDGLGSGPVSADEAQDLCHKGCEHQFECDPTGQTVDECTTDCVADVSAGWVRGDAFEDITECMLDLACTASDDVCLTECSPTSAHNTYEAQCREVFAPCVTEPAQLDGLCEVTPTSTTDDVGFLCLVTPGIMEEMVACIPDGTACEAGSDCIQGVLASHGFDI